MTGHDQHLCQVGKRQPGRPLSLMLGGDFAIRMKGGHAPAGTSLRTIDIPSSPPRIWLLHGHKVGDNAQLTALAEALGWPFEVRCFAYRRTELLTNRLLGVTLAGIRPGRSSALTPPWPDLVLTAGRRNEPVARWIRREAGGASRVKLVHVGRPWAPLDEFDLVVTTPQYFLPERPNVLHNEAPIHRLDEVRLATERAFWAPRLAALPQPRLAVVLGGHSGPYTFDREAGALLGWHANAMAAAEGGSLLVTTSARTPPAATDALAAQIQVPHELFRWSRGAPENPYVGYLANADRVIVTGDSMSMLIEAIATGRPVSVFDLARGPGSRRPPPPADGSIAPLSAMERVGSFRMQPVWYWLGQHVGPRQLRRDVGAIHRAQIAAGRAAWLGDPPPEPGRAPPLADTERAAARVRALLEAPR